MNKRPTQTDQGLRQRAERLLDASPDGALVASSPSEAKQLLHELLVHQIELEMQNEELRRPATLIYMTWHRSAI